MAYKTISFCDGCGKEAPFNQNYSRPTDWIGCEFQSNGRSKSSLDFCSIECIKKFIDSNALGNAIGHNIKEFASSEDSE